MGACFVSIARFKRRKSPYCARSIGAVVGMEGIEEALWSNFFDIEVFSYRIFSFSLFLFLSAEDPCVS
jgi:hypothetical protein